MNAAEVLGNVPAVLYEWDDCEKLVAALLAHGEQGQGVTIEADGDLHPKDPPMTTRLPDGTLWALKRIPPAYVADHGEESTAIYALVPLSAEAGDR